MRPKHSLLTLAAVLSLLTLSAPAGAAPVSAEDLLGAQANAGEWLTYGRNYLNQRFSPLDKITKENAARLKPVFAYSTGGKFAGLEATPLFHDGTLYFSGDYSRVFALDARTGTLRWYWEPEYEEGLEAILCCGPVNRGLAIHGDKVFVGTLDARLVALNAKDGTVAWQQKVEDWKAAYSITGAPLVVGDLVITGIGGAEYGVRGFVQAFKAETGEPAWKTFVIPGPGEPGNETWPGETWKTGGASTWQTGAYDPETRTLLWGTGNPGPWNSDLRKGDNKWSCSLVAMDVDSGKIKWAYQYTPNDGWDYDGNNAPALLDVTIDGKPRKVAVQANRNGFLYVLDRTNGEFIYAVPTIDGINWTSGLDPKTGRPTVNEASGRGAAGPRSSRSCRASRAAPTGSRSRPIPSRGSSISTPTTGRWRSPPGSPRTSSTRPARSIWASTTRCTGTRSRRATSRPSTSRTGSGCGSCRARCRCSRACWRPRAACVFTGDQLGFFKAVDAADRPGAVEVPDRLRHQRLADHLRARRAPVRGDPVRPRRRSQLLLLGPEGWHAVGVRGRRRGAGHDGHRTLR